MSCSEIRAGNRGLFSLSLDESSPKQRLLGISERLQKLSKVKMTSTVCKRYGVSLACWVESCIKHAWYCVCKSILVHSTIQQSKDMPHHINHNRFVKRDEPLSISLPLSVSALSAVRDNASKQSISEINPFEDLQTILVYSLLDGPNLLGKFHIHRVPHAWRNQRVNGTNRYEWVSESDATHVPRVRDICVWMNSMARNYLLNGIIVFGHKCTLGLNSVRKTSKIRPRKPSELTVRQTKMTYAPKGKGTVRRTSQSVIIPPSWDYETRKQTKCKACTQEWHSIQVQSIWCLLRLRVWVLSFQRDRQAKWRRRWIYV